MPLLDDLWDLCVGEDPFLHLNHTKNGFPPARKRQSVKFLSLKTMVSSLTSLVFPTQNDYAKK